MITEYKRDFNNNYLVLSDEALMFEDYKMKMLVSNKIPTLLKCSLRKFDGEIKLFYEITSKQTMLRVFEKKTIGSKDLINIITSFSKAIKSCREYLLDINDFVLDPEYIYTNMDSNEIYFCYMPGFSQDVNKSFNELCTYILERVDHNDKQAVAASYELFKNTLADNYSISKVLEEIKPEHIEKENNTVKNDNSEIVHMTEKNDIPKGRETTDDNDKKTRVSVFIFGGITISAAVLFLIYYIYDNYSVFNSIDLSSDLIIKCGGLAIVLAAIISLIVMDRKRNKKEDNNKDTEENSIVILEEKRNEEIDSLYMQTSIKIDEDCKNTVLLAYREAKKRLVSTKDIYKSFDINEESFLIGKLEGYVDGIIEDEMVSRIHAKIFKNDDKYYLIDLNSTNGTFHNGKRLGNNESVEIKNEDTITFARAEYVFR